MAELQTIPARHGVATFVPAGHVIKIVNSSGTQVVDTWAFALPKPDSTKARDESEKPKQEDSTPAANTKKKNRAPELPSQEEAEKATRGAQDATSGEDASQQKSTWSSYVPSLGLGGGKKGENKEQDTDSRNKDETEQQKNSRTWGSYFTAGKGFSSYIPQQASDTVSQFASYHERDKNKTYLQQLSDFSQTPVGAAGWKGMAAMTGSGYSGSLYAGYQAWNAKSAAEQGQMEFMSMPHTRAATLHLRPQVNDTLVTNIREPILTLVEDTSSGIHDTLIAACDPQRYRGLGVPKWEEHGSCAENLVLALRELNERAGLKGAKAVGAQVMINNVPAPLNLFMNIPWDEDGGIGFHGPKSKPGDYVRFKAERDVVVVMSACPQDVLDINVRNPTDANFLVEDSEGTAAAIKRTAPPKQKKPPPRKTATSQAPSSGTAPPKKKPTPPKVPPPKKPPPAKPATAQPAQKPYAPAKNASTGPQVVKQASSDSPAQAAAAPIKKPVPSQAKSVSTVSTGETTPAERKKPRKLTRPQATAGAEG